MVDFTKVETSVLRDAIKWENIEKALKYKEK